MDDRRRDPFFERLLEEMTMRARLLLAGGNAGKAGRMLPDDLAQEALAKLLDTYDEPSLRERPHNQLMALAYRAMRNLVIDQGRKKGAYLEDKRDDDGPARVLPDVGPTPDALAEASERAVKLRAQLERLSPEERCFITEVMRTDSVPEATKKCGWPPKSPYYVLRKLLAKLRDALTELSPEEVGG